MDAKNKVAGEKRKDERQGGQTAPCMNRYTHASVASSAESADKSTINDQPKAPGKKPATITHQSIDPQLFGDYLVWIKQQRDMAFGLKAQHDRTFGSRLPEQFEHGID